MAGPSGNLLRPPTLKDVAREAGVSVATVSHVLNADSAKYVSSPLRERVRQAAEALGYQPNILARGMRGKGRRALAILVPQFENFFFTNLIIGAERAAYSHGYVLLICSTYDDPERERFYVEQLVSQQVDGFLLSPTRGGTDNTKVLRDRSIPYVIVDRRLWDYTGPYDYVGFSNRLGAKLATEHLVARGHRRIGFIGWQTEVPVIAQRYDGFRDATAACGLDEAACPARLGGLSKEEGARLARELVSEHDVTAILAAHQYMGEGVLPALRGLGKVVPKEISLIVYGRPPWTALVEPALVCVEMPDHQLGEQAVSLLIDRVLGRRTVMEEFVLDTTLSAGDSVVDGPGW